MEMSVLYTVGQMKIISILRVQLVGCFQNHGSRFLGEEGKIYINMLTYRLNYFLSKQYQYVHDMNISDIMKGERLQH